MMRKVFAVLLALLLAVSLSTVQAEEEAAEESLLLTLSSFDCEDLDGNPVDFSLFDGASVVLINCWETWCPWCVKEMPDFNELYELYRDRGLLIVGLSGIATYEGDDPKGKAEELGIVYPLVHGGAELLPFEPDAFPTTFVYTPQEDGTLQLVGYLPGYLPRENWESFLLEYLPETVPEA